MRAADSVKPRRSSGSVASSNSSTGAWRLGLRTRGMIRIVHVTDEVLAPLRARYGAPIDLEWTGEITEREHALATYNPTRTHDVTLFILDPDDRIALIRKPHFAAGIWRPPGGGIKPGEDFVLGAEREALEETGLAVCARALSGGDARARSSTRGGVSPGARTSSSRAPRTRCSRRVTRTRSRARAGARSTSWQARCASGCSRPATRSGATGSPARRGAQGSSRMNE